jgi:MFS family permease
MADCLYLASAVAQPSMWRLADLFSPRRIYLISLFIVAISALVGWFAPSLGVLIAVCRRGCNLIQRAGSQVTRLSSRLINPLLLDAAYFFVQLQSIEPRPSAFLVKSRLLDQTCMCLP